jgi:hypothetical protein
LKVDEERLSKLLRHLPSGRRSDLRKFGETLYTILSYSRARGDGLAPTNGADFLEARKHLSEGQSDLALEQLSVQGALQRLRRVPTQYFQAEDPRVLDESFTVTTRHAARAARKILEVSYSSDLTWDGVEVVIRSVLETEGLKPQAEDLANQLYRAGYLKQRCCGFRGEVEFYSCGPRTYLEERYLELLAVRPVAGCEAPASGGNDSRVTGPRNGQRAGGRVCTTVPASHATQ